MKNPLETSGRIATALDVSTQIAGVLGLNAYIKTGVLYPANMVIAPGAFAPRSGDTDASAFRQDHLGALTTPIRQRP